MIKSFANWVAILALSALITFGVILVWLYGGKLNSTKLKWLTELNLPVAVVGTRAISAQEFKARLNLWEKLHDRWITFDEASPNEKQILLDRLVFEYKIKSLATNDYFNLTQAELDSQFSNLMAQNGFTTTEAISGFLTNLGLSRYQFEKEVMVPQALESKLQIWLNANESFDPTFTQANKIIADLQAGRDFADLATQYNQNPTLAKAQGDMGFVDPVTLPDELREAVSSLTAGNVKIIPGQLGLYIVKLEETSGNLFHLRAIFLNGPDFQNWFDNETKTIKVIQLVNF